MSELEESIEENGFLTYDEVRKDLDVVVEEEEPVVEEDEAEEGEVLRGTEKPAEDEVTFKVIRGFTWHGNKLEAGETYTWSEDEYSAMMYDVNLRTDRQTFVVPA